MIDYFSSPAQERLEKIFIWDEAYFNKPGKSLIKLLRMISRDVALPIVRPYTLLVDGNPTTSFMVSVLNYLSDWLGQLFFDFFFCYCRLKISLS